MSADGDDELIEEQIDFYRNDATDDYGFYVPRDGISVRDHFGRRWRVIHNLWHRDELSSRLGDLGWNIDFVGPGLFANIVWAEPTR